MIVGYFGVFSGLVGALLIGGVVAAKPVAGKLAAAAGVVAVFVMLVRIFTAGISCDDRGVTVRGFARSRRIYWAEVDDFVTVPTRSVNGGAYIGVQCRNGSRAVTQALTTASADSAFAHRVLADLRGRRPAA